MPVLSGSWTRRVVSHGRERRRGGVRAKSLGRTPTQSPLVGGGC